MNVDEVRILLARATIVSLADQLTAEGQTSGIGERIDALTDREVRDLALVAVSALAMNVDVDMMR